MKSKTSTLLFSCLGFVMGFAVCYHLFVLHANDETIITPAVQTDQKQGMATYQQPTTQVIHPAAVEERSPVSAPPTERRRLVTVWHPTYPPQLVGRFDYLQYAAESMTRSNR